MQTFLKYPLQLHRNQRMDRPVGIILMAITFASAPLMSGCAVEVQNIQPAQELVRRSQPPGSVYAGWRLFQDKCAGCHGTAAKGSVAGPDLLHRVMQMGPHEFVDIVLKRYKWNLPVSQSSTESSTRVDLIEGLVQRKTFAITMPAWQSEPIVTVHIVDLYAYLSARAQGVQGPGRPEL